MSNTLNYLQKRQLSHSGDLKAAIEMALTQWSQVQLETAALSGQAMDYLTSWTVKQIIANPTRHVERFARYAVLSLVDEIATPIANKNSSNTESMQAFNTAMVLLDSALDTLVHIHILAFAEQLAPPEPIVTEDV